MRWVCALTAVLVACALAAPAEAAAPRFILVSGPGLAQPALLDDWNENLMFLISLLPARRAPAGWRAQARPRYDLALFWGVPALPVPADARRASQHGWFYPAGRGRPAVVDLALNGKRFPRLATPQALHILRRHGVPTKA